MTANAAPMFVGQGQSAWCTLTTQNTAIDGTGTVGTCFTADATNGSFLESLRIQPLGTNVPTVLRVFENNGSTNATAANNTLLFEVTLPTTTASAVAALPSILYPMNRLMAPGYKINVTLGTTVSAGWQVTGAGGKY